MATAATETVGLLHRVNGIGRRVFHRVLMQNYHTARAYYLWKLSRKDGGCGRRVLFYSMAKVGSTSVFRSVSRHSSGLSTFHFHTLDPDRLARADRFWRERWRRRSTRGGPRFLWDGQYVRRLLDSVDDGRPLKIVTLVRDPVAKSISHFFDIVQMVYGYDFELALQSKGVDTAVQELISKFQFEYAGSGQDPPATWLCQEIHRHFGIDAYASPFCQEAGYAVYRGERADLLLMRLEDLDRIGESAIRDYLDMPDFCLSRANSGEQGKAYSQLYRPFLKSIALPDAYLDQMYDSRFARHFYTAEERAAFKRKWQSPQRPDEALGQSVKALNGHASRIGR